MTTFILMEMPPTHATCRSPSTRRLSPDAWYLRLLLWINTRKIDKSIIRLAPMFITFRRRRSVFAQLAQNEFVGWSQSSYGIRERQREKNIENSSFVSEMCGRCAVCAFSKHQLRVFELFFFHFCNAHRGNDKIYFPNTTYDFLCVIRISMLACIEEKHQHTVH